MTNTCFSRQKFCHDKHVFVVTKHVFYLSQQMFCSDKHNFVATNVFLRQAYFCHHKRRVLSWQTYVCCGKSSFPTSLLGKLPCFMPVSSFFVLLFLTDQRTSVKKHLRATIPLMLSAASNSAKCLSSNSSSFWINVQYMTGITPVTINWICVEN